MQLVAVPVGSQQALVGHGCCAVFVDQMTGIETV
jgi:hypothetical protein